MVRWRRRSGQAPPAPHYEQPYDPRYAQQPYAQQPYGQQQYEHGWGNAPHAAQPQPHQAVPPNAHAVAPAPPQHATADEAWPGICEQFSQQVLLLAEQLRPAMDRLETEEDDPDRLQLLYEVDHAVTRMRRAARGLRVLAGTGAEELDGHTTSLVDVIRIAESSIERYTHVAIGKVVQLAVVAYAAEDVAALVVALLDNATRYSPSTVTVSAHLLDNGAVMMRVEDGGIGIDPERVKAINALLAGPVPPPTPETGLHTGFPIVHRLARKHDIGVRLACRPSGNGAQGGTVAMVVIPPELLCEVPGEVPAPVGGHGQGVGERALAHLTMAHRAEPPERPLRAAPGGTGSGGTRPGTEAVERPATGGALPRRESMSLRRMESDGGPGGREAAPRDPAEAAEAARAFAADIEAFSSGGQAAFADGEDAGDGTEGRSR
ncbi:hypothetical protein GCM10010191_52320 [Actinomadura vinacea]|uniref:histidine kinase n=1 Tax=Actinomadura vinacea TaxID=115336 RepID=A0ABN3JJT1_9ACTN